MAKEAILLSLLCRHEDVSQHGFGVAALSAAGCNPESKISKRLAGRGRKRSGLLHCGKAGHRRRRGATMGNSVTSVARFGRKSRAGELADGSGSGQRALPAAQRPQECSSSQSSCSSYNACDSDGLPDRMRHPSDSLDHAAGTPESPAFACSSVKGLRREMEDEHIAARPLLCQNGLPAANLFGVFDGHGGRKCAQYLHKHLAPAVRGSLLQMNDGGSRSAAIENALKSAFCEVDSAFLSTIGREEVGSTAIVVLQEGKTLYCANTGDSRAILCRADGPTPLSSDHKPSRPDEKKRIEDAGGQWRESRQAASFVYVLTL